MPLCDRRGVDLQSAEIEIAAKNKGPHHQSLCKKINIHFCKSLCVSQRRSTLLLDLSHGLALVCVCVSRSFRSAHPKNKLQRPTPPFYSNDDDNDRCLRSLAHSETKDVDCRWYDLASSCSAKSIVDQHRWIGCGISSWFRTDATFSARSSAL